MAYTYIEDIFSQPESLKECGYKLGDQAETVKKIRQKSKDKRYDRIIFTGMGSSNYCSITAERYLSEHGWFSNRYSTAELLHSYFHVIQDDTLLVVVSQSGESGEVVRLLEKLEDKADSADSLEQSEKVTVIGITNEPESTLARKSTYTLYMNVESEQSVTTRTYMAGLAVTLFLAMSLTGISYERFLKGLLKCIQNMEEMLNNSREWREKLENFLDIPDIGAPVWFLGRGLDYGTALAGALFFREVSRVMSAAEYCGEFRHGPFEVVDSQFRAVLIVTDGEVHELNRKLAENIRGKGGRVFIISNWDEQEPAAVLTDCGKWYSQFLTIIPIQLLADYIAEKKGIKAGEFRWGSKITKGE